MRKEDCYRLGVVTGTHGIRGDLHCLIDADDPQRYTALDSVYLEMGDELVAWHVQSISIRGTTALLHLSGVDDLTAAGPLKRRALYIPLDRLPEPGPDRFYLHEVFGFTVCDRRLGVIGILQGIVEMPGQPLAQIRREGKEILMPMVKEFIERVDKEGKTLHVSLPDGLVELF